MSPALVHPDGRVQIDEIGNGRRRISVELEGEGASPIRSSWETTYPPELIEAVLRVRGPTWVCDEIMREEDPAYVERSLSRALFSYRDKRAFSGKRLLDVGCGSGSSSLVLARILDEVEIVGAELVEDLVELARQRACFRNATNLSFHLSPGGEHLPEGIGTFDFIVLSAVFEHLLPVERRELLPLIWMHLRPGGVLFIDQLPHRFALIERHTTGLPLINYLPAGLAHLLAMTFSPQVAKGRSWETLLRWGVRGGTTREVLGILRGTPDQPALQEPCRQGMRDRIDLSPVPSRRWQRAVLKALKRTTGITFIPDLTLAIEKRRP